MEQAVRQYGRKQSQDGYYDINAKPEHSDNNKAENAAAKPFDAWTQDQVDCPATMERLRGDMHKEDAATPQKSNDYNIGDVSSPASSSYDTDYFETKNKIHNAEQYDKHGVESAVKQEKERMAEEEDALPAAPALTANTTSARKTIDIDYVINKRKEMREAAKKVRGEIRRYKTTYTSNKDSWKRSRGICFYKLLYDWLTHQAGCKIAIRNYDANKLPEVIAEFESTMANLITSQSEEINKDNYNNVEYYVNLIKTWVEEVKEMYSIRE